METEIINNTHLQTEVVKFWAEFSLWGSFSHNKIHKSAQVQNFRKKQLFFPTLGSRTKYLKGLFKYISDYI